MTFARAQAAAERLLRRLRVTSMPVDVDLIATRLGVDVLYEPLGDSAWAILISSPAGMVACINKTLPKPKQRGMLAHQLGHIVLRHPLPEGEHVHVDCSMGGYKDAEGQPKQRELEASAFGLSLLMPAKQVQDAVAAVGHTALSEEDVEAMANTFGVSGHGMMMRLSRMGIV
jgi:Zn-dependent protease with chaperone function